jgi:DNA-binding transcriptional LysR family regulator
MRREHPDAEVQVTHLDWGQALDALLGHRVDAVVTRLPFPTDGLHVTVLYDEPRVLAIPVDHRLAGREESASFTGEGECFIEMGRGVAGFARGNFYAEPEPQVRTSRPGRHWHGAKVLFERHWWQQWW